MNNKIALVLSLLLLAVSATAQQQNVSGKVSNKEGAIANVSVREIDGNRRIFNHTKTDENGIFSFKVKDAQHHLQFYAPGYRTLTHKMLGQHSFNVTLEQRRLSPYISREKILLKSKKMICGHYLGDNVNINSWIGQLADTLYTLVLPISVSSMVDEYPAGRTLLVLGDYDRQMMMLENVVDAYPVAGDPDEMTDRQLTKSSTGVDKTPGVVEQENLYCYPRFQLTGTQMQYLIDHSAEVKRIVVDTYRADNYWNYFPAESLHDMLEKALQKSK